MTAIFYVLKYSTQEEFRGYAAKSGFRRTRERTEAVNKQDEAYRKLDRLTILIYLSIFVMLVLAALYASRYVIFHPWTARDWVAAAGVDGKIYIAGGKDRAGSIYDTVYRIEPERLKIRSISRLPSPRFGMGAAALEGKVYFLGGFDGRKVFDEVLALDPNSGKLRLLTHLPGPRAFGAVAVSSGKLFYLGGWDGREPFAEVIRIDPQTGATEIAGRLSSPREYAAAAALSEGPLSDRIYLFGGSGDRGEYDEILEIHDGSGQTIRVGRLPDQWVRGSAVAVEERIFLLGGWDGKKLDVLWAVDPSAAALEAEPVGHLPAGMSDAASVWLGGVIYLIGGEHERFARQIRVFRIDPADLTAESLQFRNFLFW